MEKNYRTPQRTTKIMFTNVMHMCICLFWLFCHAHLYTLYTADEWSSQTCSQIFLPFLKNFGWRRLPAT